MRPAPPYWYARLECEVTLLAASGIWAMVRRSAHTVPFVVRLSDLSTLP